MQSCRLYWDGCKFMGPPGEKCVSTIKPWLNFCTACKTPSIWSLQCHTMVATSKTTIYFAWGNIQLNMDPLNLQNNWKWPWVVSYWCRNHNSPSIIGCWKNTCGIWWKKRIVFYSQQIPCNNLGWWRLVFALQQSASMAKLQSQIQSHRPCSTHLHNCLWVQNALWIMWIWQTSLCCLNWRSNFWLTFICVHSKGSLIFLVILLDLLTLQILCQQMTKSMQEYLFQSHQLGNLLVLCRKEQSGFSELSILSCRWVWGRRARFRWQKTAWSKWCDQVDVVGLGW